MHKDKATLFVLGSSLTSLAIIRDAARSNIKCIVIDTDQDIASSSSLAKFFLVGKSQGEMFELLKSLCVAGKNYTLIATSDKWLNFIINNRDELGKYIENILHANNKALDICLNKRQFSDWCNKNGISTPYLYSDNEASFSYLQREIQEHKKRIFLRPVNSSAAQRQFTPKALEISDIDNLKKWVEHFKKSNVSFVVTESLLSEELIQYSIPFLRTEKEFTCLTAIKARPEANDCAVGTYVYSIQAPELETLAFEVTSKLDYLGMGEIEVLYSVSNSRYYVIEINARPWLQYELVVKAGCQYLASLVLNQQYKHNIRKDNVYWLSFVDDFYVCFSKSTGYVRSRKISLYRYIQSLWRANAHPVLSFRDPTPIWYSLKSFIRLFKM